MTNRAAEDSAPAGPGLRDRSDRAGGDELAAGARRRVEDLDLVAHSGKGEVDALRVRAVDDGHASVREADPGGALRRLGDRGVGARERIRGDREEARPRVADLRPGRQVADVHLPGRGLCQLVGVAGSRPRPVDRVAEPRGERLQVADGGGDGRRAGAGRGGATGGGRPPRLATSPAETSCIARAGVGSYTSTW